MALLPLLILGVSAALAVPAVSQAVVVAGVAVAVGKREMLSACGH